MIWEHWILDGVGAGPQGCKDSACRYSTGVWRYRHADMQLWDMGYGILGMGHGVWDMGYGTWDTGILGMGT